ncbi:MAG: restriction endonuclease subunit S, partial [Lactococcus lactis]|nr:restriction endonuclease subunit S [Lactococcus lactis]
MTGGTPKTSITEYWEPKIIPWMSSGEVNKRRITKTDNLISEKGLNNSSARWVKEKSVLIALAGQGKTRGTVAINNIPLTTNQSIAAIVPEKVLHYEFIFQNLIKRYDELRMISSGDGTRGGLNKQIISEVIIPFPDKIEQIKIGNLFCSIDDTITLHQRKLD